MTYQQAHNILHDHAPDDPENQLPPPLTAGYPVDPKNVSNLKGDLEILTRLARKLRKDREEIGGAVDLSSGDLGTELKFVLDENGNPTKVAPKKELEIHHTIAEMMIFANQSVATKIFEHFPDSSLLRIHSSVEHERFEDLENVLRAGGIAFDGSSNMALANSLKQAKQRGQDSQVVNSLWQSLATRYVWWCRARRLFPRSVFDCSAGQCQKRAMCAQDLCSLALPLHTTVLGSTNTLISRLPSVDTQILLCTNNFSRRCHISQMNR